MGNFLFFAAIIALIVILLIRLFKKSKATEEIASNASNASNSPEGYYYPDNLPLIQPMDKQYIDPYDQSPLLSDAQMVTIRMNGKSLSFKTNSKNVSRVKRHGLPLKNKSFVRGNDYYISYTDNSSNYYDDNDGGGLNWWDVYWLYQVLTSDDNYQPIYGDNSFVGYGDGQTGGGGVDGDYNTVDGQQNDLQQNFDTNNIDSAVIITGDDGTTIIGSDTTQNQDNTQQDNTVQENDDADNVGNFS